MQFTKEQFSKMRWQIFDVPMQKKIVKEIPLLEEVFSRVLGSFCGVEDFDEDKLIRYVIYVYHYDSPLVKTISTDIKQRKKIAMSLLGVTPKEGYFSEFINKIIMNKDDSVLPYIHEFMKVENNLAYIELTYLNEAYFNMLEAIANRDSEVKEVLDINKNISLMRTNIADLGRLVFNGDVPLAESVGLVQISTTFAEKERKRIFPEDFHEV